MRALGIDIGGTATKGALCSEDGSVLFSFEIPTPHLTEPRAMHLFVTQIAQHCALRGVAPAAIESVGVAVAGGINPDGELVLAPNIQMDLDRLRQEFATIFSQATCAFLNDANAASLGECFAGAAKGYRSAVVLTLGTGVGAGVVNEGKIVVGANGLAGEIGHLCVESGGIPCNCGKRGCLEQYSSATALVRSYLEAQGCEGAGTAACASAGADGTGMGAATCAGAIAGTSATTGASAMANSRCTAKTVLEAYVAGDPLAARAVDTFCDKLAFALSQIAVVVDPDVFVLGGGVSKGSALFEDLLRTKYAGYATNKWLDTPIVFATLGGNAGCVGAAAFAMASQLGQ